MKVELLSPAGSYEIFVAAINSGADAVYAGGDMFGARAYAKNFSNEELLKAIDYAHIHGKKFYLTINTLLKDWEIDKYLYDYIAPLYLRGLDAVIVQDLGVLNFVKNNFPELDIHASTQMTITGEFGAEYVKNLGVKRIVTAREVSLDEIKLIKENVDIEIESFIHGALCYSYSGQCLLSSMLGGRSANRGRCAGPCRLPYSTLGVEKKYPLSLKDMCTLEILPEIIESGVFSLKIEGRMKRIEYAAGVTAIYRKYIDMYLEKGKQGYKVDPKDMEKIQNISNRSGFTKGYYKSYNSKDMITLDKPNYESDFDYIPENNIYHELTAEIKINTGEKIFMKIKGLIDVEVEGDFPQQAINAPLTKETVLKQIGKTGDTEFVFNEIKLELSDNVFVTVKELNELRRRATQEYKDRILYKYQRKLLAEKYILDQKPNEPQLEKMKINCFIENIDLFQVVVCNKEIDSIYLYYNAVDLKKIDDYVLFAHENNKKIYLALPVIFREKAKEYFDKNIEWIKKSSLDGYLIKNFEEMGYFKEKASLPMIADSTIYIFNKYAKNQMEKLGFEHLTVPFELNEKEIEKIGTSGSEMIVYGHQELMNTSNCIKKTLGKCDKKADITYLNDRYNKNFPVKSDCSICNNTLYNCNPLSLLSQAEKIKMLSLGSVRLNFTSETKEQAENIMQSFTNRFIYDKTQYTEIENFTKGHFKRGVE